MKDSQTGRRKFLKNVSLASLSIAAMPSALASSKPEELQTAPPPCDQTTLDFYGQGPFYTPNAPQLANGMLAAANEPGTRIVISGRIMNLDCTEAIVNAEIDVWHADDAGQYDNTGFNLRGRLYSNAQGFYNFETIWPGKYLNGSQFRPAHIHFRITPNGGSTLITQLYFQGDTSIPADAAASLTSGTYDASARIIPLNLNNATGKYEGNWDIVINAQGTPIGLEDLHLDKGILYSAQPNPFWDRLDINYGVFQEAVAKLTIYDIQGREVARIKEQVSKAQKSTATWVPPADLAEGVYFLTLAINDLQVHYLRLVRQAP